MRRTSRTVLLALVLALAVATVGVAQEEGGGGTEEEVLDLTISPTGATDMSVRLAQFVDGDPVDRVVLASEASFADAMGSALLQQGGPLLLVPPTLPLPGQVATELERLAPAEVVLLGGPAAIGEDVEGAITDLGFATTRIAGATRFETAVEIARQTRPNATQAILVRAFDAEGGNDTAAWADSVAAGAASTQLQIPILLTDSRGLTASTADYLLDSAISTVIIVGGEAAVSAGIEQQLVTSGFIVSRVAGGTRFETALAIADFRRVAGTRAILVDGLAEDGWQAGFAAARHAWLEGAPVLATAGGEVPGSVAQYLQQAQPAALTCIEVIVPGCGAAGGGGGNSASSAEVVFNPPAGSAIHDGETIVVGVDDPERTLTGAISVASNCPVSGFSRPPEYTAEAVANFQLALEPGEEPGGDQPRPLGPVLVQGGTSTPVPGATGQPIEDNEPTPSDAPSTCEVTATLGTTSGEDLIAISSYNVIDLRPRIRISSFATVEDEPVAFTDATGGIVETWSWEFGDGGTSSEENPDHTFGDPGCYEVTLDVTSPLRHWFDGSSFEDGVARLVAVDPADSSEAHVAIFVGAGYAPHPGVTVEMRDADGALVATAVSGSDGVAEFADALDGTPGHGEYHFSAPSETAAATVQTVTPGQTVCPGLSTVPTGTLTFEVQTDAEQPQPIPGARVDLQAFGFQFGGFTDAEGRFMTVLMPAGSYSATVTAEDFVSEVVSTTVVAGEETAVPVALTSSG